MHTESASIQSTCADVAKLPTHCLFVYLHKQIIFSKIGQEHRLWSHGWFWLIWEISFFNIACYRRSYWAHVPPTQKIRTLCRFRPVGFRATLLLLGQRNFAVFFSPSGTLCPWLRVLFFRALHAAASRASADILARQNAQNNRYCKNQLWIWNTSKSAINVKNCFDGLSRVWKK